MGEDKNKERFYEHYDEIRDFMKHGIDLKKEEEVMALSDLLFNTRHIKENKKAREDNEYINLLCQERGIEWTLRREAIKKAKEELRILVRILIYLHLDEDEREEFD